MKTLKWLALFLPAFLGISCAGIGFEKAWNQAVAEHHAAKSPDPVTGPWDGTWETETNGHKGDLRCLVTPSEKADGSYDFRYSATYFKVLRGAYKVNFDVNETPQGYRVEGSKDLGIFGKFKHDGLIRGNAFDATYSNKKGDVGSFEMKRP